MTSTRLLARNTAFNLAGQVLPLGVAVVAVPVLLRALGSDRFGILTLAWALIGYFAILDFGVGRALTQAASEAIGIGDTDRLRELSLVAIVTMVGFGVIGGIVVSAATPWLAFTVLNMDDALRAEAAGAFYILAATLPFVLATIGFRALLEAHQHFGIATALRMPYAIFNFVGPLIVLPFSTRLVPIVGALAAGRIIMLVAHMWVCARQYPWLRRAPMGSLRALRPLLRTGGWMMVSNVASPLMVYVDRFIIGAMISMTAVAYYVTPSELISKLLIVPAAIIGVFFPAFAATYGQDRTRTAMMFDRANRLVLIVVFPVVLMFVAFARETLLLWVGPDFARNSTTILQLLAIGVLINSFAQAPFALLQAARRADLTGKLHLLELPVYGALIVGLGWRYGVTGVALAWTLRVSIDTALLCWLSRRQLSELAPALDRSLVWLGGLTAVLCAFTLTLPLAARAAAATLALLVFAASAWFNLLSISERFAITDGVRWRPRRSPSVT